MFKLKLFVFVFLFAIPVQSQLKDGIRSKFRPSRYSFNHPPIQEEYAPIPVVIVYDGQDVTTEVSKTKSTTTVETTTEGNVTTFHPNIQFEQSSTEAETVSTTLRTTQKPKFVKQTYYKTKSPMQRGTAAVNKTTEISNVLEKETAIAAITSQITTTRRTQKPKFVKQSYKSKSTTERVIDTLIKKSEISSDNSNIKLEMANVHTVSTSEQTSAIITQKPIIVSETYMNKSMIEQQAGKDLKLIDISNNQQNIKLETTTAAAVNSEPTTKIIQKPKFMKQVYRPKPTTKRTTTTEQVTTTERMTTTQRATATERATTTASAIITKQATPKDQIINETFITTEKSKIIEPKPTTVRPVNRAFKPTELPQTRIKTFNPVQRGYQVPVVIVYDPQAELQGSYKKPEIGNGLDQSKIIQKYTRPRSRKLYATKHTTTEKQPSSEVTANKNSTQNNIDIPSVIPASKIGQLAPRTKREVNAHTKKVATIDQLNRATTPFPKRNGTKAPRVAIVESENYVYSDNGKYHYSYESGDGTRAFEEGELKSHDDTKGQASVGGFSYKDKEGNDFSLSYTADENGYRPVGAHLPTPPPVPLAIARALRYLATKTTESDTVTDKIVKQ